MAHTHTESPNIVVSESVRINRPATDVFTYVSTYENDPSWRSAVTSMTQDTPGQPLPETTTIEVLSFMGNETITVAKVVEYEAGRRVAFQSTEGPVEASGYRLVEPDGNGCTLTYHLQLLISGLPQPVLSEIAAEIGNMVHEDLQQLKTMLETVPAEHADLVGTLARG